MNVNYRFISDKHGVDSFDFTVFGIHGDKVDIIINKEQYQRIHKDQLNLSNVKRITNED